MTCFAPPNHRNRTVVVPNAIRYSTNFHAPIFKRVTIVSTACISHHPPPIKIVIERIESKITNVWNLKSVKIKIFFIIKNYLQALFYCFVLDTQLNMSYMILFVMSHELFCYKMLHNIFFLIFKEWIKF